MVGQTCRNSAFVSQDFIPFGAAVQKRAEEGRRCTGGRQGVEEGQWKAEKERWKTKGVKERGTNEDGAGSLKLSAGIAMAIRLSFCAFF